MNYYIQIYSDSTEFFKNLFKLRNPERLISLLSTCKISELKNKEGFLPHILRSDYDRNFIWFDLIKTEDDLPQTLKVKSHDIRIRTPITIVNYKIHSSVYDYLKLRIL